MDIVTENNAWVVKSIWFGELRTIYGPATVIECCQYVRINFKES